MELKQFAMVFVAMLVLAPAAFATYTCNSSSIVGDVNGDGQITMDDANAASYLFMHSNELPPNICCIDVAPSVGVNNGDAVKISLYVNNGGPNANTGDIGKRCYEINNQPPVITSIGGPTSINSGQAGTWTISAYDPDGTYLSYSINWGENNGATPSSPSTATTSTATFQHTYSQAGTYTVTFIVTDIAGASTQSTITVNIVGAVANQPPVIASVTGPSTVQIGQMPFWTISASDPEGSPFSISTSWGDGQNSAVSGYTAANMPAQVGHAYQAAGTYTITFTVTDSAGATAQSTKTVTVTSTASALSMTTWAEPDVPGISYGFYVKPLDGDQVPQASSIKVTSTMHSPSTPYYPNGNTMTQVLSYVGLASQYANQGVYGWGLGNTMPCGAYYYNTTVERVPYIGGPGNLVQKSDTFVLSPPYCMQPSNQPPVITSTGGPVSLSANQQGTWSVSAYDPDGTYLSYNVVWGDEAQRGMQPSTAFGSTATFQHTYTSAGAYTITFTAKDAQGASTQSTITVGVQGTAPSDQPPTIAAFTGPSSLATGTRGWWSAKVNDQDDTNAKYIIQWGDGTSTPSASLNTGMMYNMSFDHIYSSPGTYTAVLSVTDTHGTSTAAQATASVAVGQANQPPVITSTGGPTSLSPNQQGTWSVGAYDPDGTYLTYNVVWGDEASKGMLTSASFSSTATFQHTYTSAGAYTITFTVKDAYGASTQSTITASVQGTAGSCDGFATLQVGEEVTSSGYAARLSDVSSAVRTYPAIFDIVNSQYVVVGQIQIDPGQSYIYYTPAGVVLNVSVCQTHPASALSEKWAKTKVTIVGSTSTNLPPVITSAAGPTSLLTGEIGTWKVSANDPDGNRLTYSVNWGESGKTPIADNDVGRVGNSAAFEHTYYTAGAYTIVFTVADSAGASTQSTITVNVAGSVSTSEVYASVGAIPTELYQYDSVYVTGKVSRGTAGASDDIRNYAVVLTLDNGNRMLRDSAVVGTSNGIVKESVTTGVANAAYQAGSIASVQGAASPSGQVPSQGKEEQIALAPGESREVSAYFTASQLGTNFAKILVYQKSGSAQSGYILVASDTVKVFVKQGGIPSPPNEGVTIVLQKGWNQISVPAFSLEVSKLAEKCDISTNVWYYNAASKQYEKATSLGGSHVGFWVKANAECNYTLETPYITPAPYAFNLKAGWNMIGAPLQATAVNSFAGNCKITSGPWNYAPSASQYTYSEKLETGKGYWVKVASDCIMGSDANDMPPSAPTESTQTAPRAAATQANTPVTQSQAVEPAQSVRPSSAN